VGGLTARLEQACREHVERHRGRLLARLVSEPGSGREVAREHARSLDGLLSAVFEAAQMSSTRASSGDAAGVRVALVAVGGLGRRELGLWSDLDLILLADAPRDAGVMALAEAFLHPLWNARLDIGHAVRSVAEVRELARDDLRTATMLLDARRVAGEPSIVRELEAGIAHDLPEIAASALPRLAVEREERHARYGGSPFLLEPDVKHGCGGLRDLDVVRWTLALRWGARSFAAAVEAAVLVAPEAEELEAARTFAWDVRQRLHARAGRRQDRLTFEDQEECARALGFPDDPPEPEHADRDESRVLGVERFMQLHYRHARVIEQASDRVLDRARLGPADEVEDEGLRDHPDVRIVDGALALRDASRLSEDPALAMRFYHLVEAHAVPPPPPTRVGLARAMSDPGLQARLRASADASRDFLEMLAWTGEVPVRRGSIVAELHDVGLLVAMIPELAPLMGRVQHDVYHVYTVDVHSVAAVHRLRTLDRGELAEELPLATRVATEVSDRRRLALAVLLHDIGKGRGRDHSIRGAELAVPIAERLGLAPSDVEHVRWLVLEHLRLYHWATRRDTSDPASLAEIARTLGSLDRLRDLYVLTLVDLSTTNPTALTTWKVRLFDDLYLGLAQILEGQEVAPAEDPAEELAALADARGDLPLTVTLRPGRVPGHGELVVIADDRAGLLADIAAVLAAHVLPITSATIRTRTRRGALAEALDVFGVRGPSGEGPAVDEPKLARVRADLARVIAGDADAHALFEQRPVAPAWAKRKSPDVRTEIVVDNAASPRFTVIDVFTRDREGLLHAIARALHAEGLSIALAKIATEGERVADAFYVSDRDGGKVVEPGRVARLRDALREAIRELSGGTS